MLYGFLKQHVIQRLKEAFVYIEILMLVEKSRGLLHVLLGNYCSAFFLEPISARSL